MNYENYENFSIELNYESNYELKKIDEIFNFSQAANDSAPAPPLPPNLTIPAIRNVLKTEALIHLYFYAVFVWIAIAGNLTMFLILVRNIHKTRANRVYTILLHLNPVEILK